MENELQTIVSVNGTYTSTCGYCGPPGERSPGRTSTSVGIYPMQMSCSVYQKLVDRGWRRSGSFVYKPHMQRTCCPQYAIRLNALEFEPTRNQRKALYRFNRFIWNGTDKEGDSPPEKTKVKPRKQVFSLIDSIHEAEKSFAKEGQPKLNFEITMEPAEFTEEKFALYKDYQLNVHKDKDKAPSSFKNFLCDSDLERAPIKYPGTVPPHLPTHYGTHHQLYRIDGELVAMSVLDILPGCISCVYFMYATKWDWCQFGKISVLREAALAREMHLAGLKSIGWAYLGFYVHSCPKMKYKGEYFPSFLLDPETYEWYPFKDCIPLMEKHRYACFSEPSHSHSDMRGETRVKLKDSEMKDIYFVQLAPGSDHFVARPITDSMSWKYYRDSVVEAIVGMGLPIAQEVFFQL